VSLRNPLPEPFDFFGHSVAISERLAVVGRSRPEISGVRRGGAYVYDLENSSPGTPAVTFSDPKETSAFGASVAIDGTTLVMGAPQNEIPGAASGAAYIFGLPPVLCVTPVRHGFAQLSWTPTTSSGFKLQYRESLGSANWIEAESGEANPAIIPTGAGSRFYRLFQP
jgi:hypothetical protein